MASSSTSSDPRFVVYMPESPDSLCQGFYLSKEAKVHELLKQIYAHPSFEHARNSKKDISLHKCGELSMRTPNERYNEVKAWLSTRKYSTIMEHPRALKVYFPNAPAPVEDDKIDIIVVTGPILENLYRSSTPENQTYIPTSITPRESVEKTRESVEEFLKKYDAQLKDYIAGPPWIDFWQASSSADNNTAEFLNRLEIPKVSDGPVLLLHHLGSDVVDSTVIDELFAKESRFLVNASGSGKTRLLFEGLVRHWGFYFTISVNALNDWLGSSDMEYTIDKGIPRTKCFIRRPHILDARRREDAYVSNHYTAERRVHQVLMARVLMFERFLRMVQETFPLRSINEFKTHWLFLQLRSMRFLGVDVFLELSDILNDANDQYLKIRTRLVHSYLIEIQETFNLDEEFFLVLDEAQVAIDTLKGCFCSEQGGVGRPVLRPIIKAWREASEFPIIVSGTSLSIDVVNDVVTPAVIKRYPFELATKTGAFDNKDHQSRYILRYMPASLAGSVSGNIFLERVWNYVRGRHRFTARLLYHLLKFGFRSPHRILNAFVEVSCGFTPSDGQHFVELEENISGLKEVIGATVFLDFSKIMEDSFRRDLFIKILHTWLMLREHLDIDKRYNDLVELGFARFVDAGEEDAVVDEPIVLLSAARHFDRIGFSLGDCFWDALDSIWTNEGDDCKTCIAYYIACSFGNETKLSDIFHFGESAPEWADEPAELVSISLKGEVLEANRFHLLDYLASTSAIGVKCRDMQKTTKWFENPSSVMCFPDNNMGPDIVFFIRLWTGLIVAVLVQCEFGDQEKSLRPADATDARERVLGLFNRLNGPSVKLDRLFPDGVPVLKVIASQSGPKPPPFHTILNRDRCEEDMEETVSMLEQVALSFGSKRTWENECVNPSRKRQRT
ncbi:hypothetical protein ACEPAI_2910 [Sanghuangporus weigelae]